MYASNQLLRDSFLSSNHPYLYETTHLQYPERLFEFADPIAPLSFENTPFIWINTPDQLPPLLEKLLKAQEIAIDLEYHSLRSYYGFVCLMQISTREEDFIIDTLALREELEVLNEVFTHPSIIKVCVRVISIIRNPLIAIVGLARSR